MRASTQGFVAHVIRFTAVASLAAAAPSAAQDIETLSRVNGVPLPPAYFQQIREQPDLYEFERALFRRGVLARTASEGAVRIPIVLALFNDSPLEPGITRDMVDQSLFTGPSERGTITASYQEMSFGALDVGGDVYGWVRSDLTMTQVVGADRGFGADARIGEYLVGALDSIDADVDFSQYDNDGPDGVANSGDDDGFVDVITFEFLEVAASCGGPAIWPHRSSIEGRSGDPYVTDDLGFNGEPIRVQDYITQSAADCTGAGVQDAGVITHEFGHALGLPDWYHWIDRSIGPFGRRWVLGCWALMAAGSWGCGPVTDGLDPFGPTHMIGYSKETLGWLEYIDIGEVWNEEIELAPIQTSGDALRIRLDAAGDEFLIAEYRGLVGFDHQLPGAGVLLYKQDNNASLRPNPASDDPYFLTMLEQDANRSLRLMAAEGGSRGQVGDAWGVEGVTGKLNSETVPQLRLASGGRTPVMVHEVYAEGDRARLVISTGRTPRLIAPAGPREVGKIRTFLEPVRIAGGTGPYTGVADLPIGFSLQPSGDELFLVGSLREEGPFQYGFAVRDAAGNLSPEITMELSAPGDWSVTAEVLLQRFLQSDEPPLTPGELEYLDDVGNDNGRYDVGDLRKWMRDNPPAPAH